MYVAVALLLPFLGTSLGAAMVFFMKKEVSPKTEKLLLGFAAGVMIAASVWSLLISSIESAKTKVKCIPAVVGFVLGIAFLLLIDSLVPHLHMYSDKPEGVKSKLSKTTMLLLAVTIHNIPEGMAVGVTYAGAVSGSDTVTLVGALTLSAGIAIQNFPEGAIISMPLCSEGMNKRKAFWCGVLSGVVEPIAALAVVALTSILTPWLPYFLSFAAGAMFYVVIEELIPESQAGEHSNVGTLGAALGFLVMMILDTMY